MRITYDQEVDVLYIKFKDGPTNGARPVHDQINIVFGQDGQIAGIELFDVSKYADHIDEIAERYDIRKVLQRESSS